jgi:molybdopterin molybdotransferase/putative molybdopterin biosynthesis protein
MSRKNDQCNANKTSNRLAALRLRRNLSAIDLAARVGVSRQTIHAIEAETYVPNTLVALKLARALEVSVEDIFTLHDGPAAEMPVERVALLPDREVVYPGQHVQLCRVDRKMIASAAAAVPWCIPLNDGVLLDKTKARVVRGADELENRILIAGCDPGMSVLARHLQLAGIEAVLAHRNSSEALALLKEGCVHVAGTHLRDAASGESNTAQIGGLFRGHTVAVISFAVWEQGLVVARGNPKGLRGIEDLTRAAITLVNREKGAGSRILLDSSLAAAGIPTRKVRGYDRIAVGHLAAAAQVRAGTADCCIAPRAAARVFGLDFIPVVSERYDLVLRRRHLDLHGVQILLETLGHARFRRDLESLGGYDAQVAGRSVV